MLPGEGATNGRVEYSNSRVADMYLGSQIVTGVAILEQSKDQFPGARCHVCSGCDALGGLYVLFETWPHVI
jgi:hypothetical protein